MHFAIAGSIKRLNLFDPVDADVHSAFVLLSAARPFPESENNCR